MKVAAAKKEKIREKEAAERRKDINLALLFSSRSVKLGERQLARVATFTYDN
jgi:hypothetical protein